MNIKFELAMADYRHKMYNVYVNGNRIEVWDMVKESCWRFYRIYQDSEIIAQARTLAELKKELEDYINTDEESR